MSRAVLQACPSPPTLSRTPRPMGTAPSTPPAQCSTTSATSSSRLVWQGQGWGGEGRQRFNAPLHTHLPCGSPPTLACPSARRCAQTPAAVALMTTMLLDLTVPREPGERPTEAAWQQQLRCASGRGWGQGVCARAADMWWGRSVPTCGPWDQQLQPVPPPTRNQLAAQRAVAAVVGQPTNGAHLRPALGPHQEVARLGRPQVSSAAGRGRQNAAAARPTALLARAGRAAAAAAPAQAQPAAGWPRRRAVARNALNQYSPGAPASCHTSVSAAMSLQGSISGWRQRRHSVGGSGGGGRLERASRSRTCLNLCNTPDSQAAASY